MAKAPDLPQCNGPRPPSLRLFDSAREGSGTLPRGHRDWHLPRRAAAGGLAGALLGPAAASFSALKSEAAAASFSVLKRWWQSPCHCMSTHCSAAFLCTLCSVMVTVCTEFDGDIHSFIHSFRNRSVQQLLQQCFKRSYACKHIVVDVDLHLAQEAKAESVAPLLQLHQRVVYVGNECAVAFTMKKRCACWMMDGGHFL